QFFELGDVGLRHDAPDDDRDVDAASACFVDDEGRECHVRTRQHRQPDRVDIFVDSGCGDGRRCLKQAGVDHFVPGIAQDAGDDLDATIVTVETDLGDQDPLSGHQL